jgi:hypothetical protein
MAGGTSYGQFGNNAGGGGGSVTAVSVATANGLAGTSSGGATPILTLTTSVTGILKGNGTAISAAVAGTDYQAPITPANLTAAGTDGIAVTGGTSAVLAAASIAQHVADATHNGYLSSTDWSTFSGKGAGTVTAVSVATANGLSGTSSGGATPALTLGTSVTGIVKGNGAALSAATAGTDYVAATSGSAVQKANGAGGLTAATAGTDFSAGTSALATGILKSTTTTGALSIAASGTDYQAPISSTTPVSHQFLTGFTSPNTFAQAQPAFTDISGTATVAQTTVGTQALGTLTTAGTVNWANGSVFTATLTSGNACTFTFSNKASGQTIVVVLTNGGSGGTATVVWPTVKWAGGSVPVMTTGTAAIDVYTFVYDGTNVYGSAIQSMS